MMQEEDEENGVAPAEAHEQIVELTRHSAALDKAIFDEEFQLVTFATDRKDGPMKNLLSLFNRGDHAKLAFKQLTSILRAWTYKDIVRRLDDMIEDEVDDCETFRGKTVFTDPVKLDNSKSLVSDVAVVLKGKADRKTLEVCDIWLASVINTKGDSRSMYFLESKTQKNCYRILVMSVSVTDKGVQLNVARHKLEWYFLLLNTDLRGLKALAQSADSMQNAIEGTEGESAGGVA